MTPERWRQVEQLFEEVLTREPESRAAFLAQATGADEEIRHAVETLLAQASAIASPDPSPSPYLSEAAPSTSLPEGFRLGPYEIAGVLGSGGMGKVYRAVDTRLGRRVAVKVSTDLPGANFKREARAISALNHPHICTLYDVGPNYLVMELVEGESLAQRLERGALPTGEALRFGAQIAEALAAAHACGVIHRDLKPGNIMLTLIGVKVLDFGLAKITPSTAGVVSYTTTTETVIQPGTVQGTLAYMAPEQLEGAECDARSDIFSLGLVLYEIATGRRAFAAASQATLIGEILHSTPDLAVLHPPGLRAVVEKCVAKRSADRWQTADEVREALQLVEKVPSAALAEMRGGVPRSSRHLWTRSIAMAAIAILVGVTAAGLWMRMRIGLRASAAPTIVQLGDFTGIAQQPSLSPDGGHIAFSWNGVDPQNFDVYVKSFGADGAMKGTALRLTTDPANDFAPAWSPDGRSIAFLRQVNGGEHYLVLIVPALGGQERRLTQITLPNTSQLSGPYLAWLGDSRSLVVTDTAAAGGANALFLLSVESGERRQITFPPAGEIGDHCVSISPDGSHLLFSRVGLRPEWSGKDYTLLLRKDAASAASTDAVEAAVNQCGAWTSDGQRIVYPAGLGMWTVPAALRGAAPQLVVETGRGTSWPTVARDGSRMAYARKVGGNLDIWQLPVSAAGEAAGTATRFVSSSRDQFSPVFSPDGSKVAFVSGRADASEIWICNRDGSKCSQLTWTASANTGDPSWSPDGRSLVYYSTQGGRARIYTIPAQGGDAHAITAADADSTHPAWSHDGKWIYFNARQGGQFQIWKVLAQGGDPVQLTQQGGYAPAESPDGRWLYYLASGDQQAGLWRMLAGRKPEQVLPSILFHNFVVTAHGIYFIAATEPAPSLQFLNLSSGRTSVIATVHSSYSGLTVSPDARTIQYTQTAPATSQIYTIENFR